MLQVRLYYVPGAVRYIGEYIYQAVLRQGILGVYKGGKALLWSRTRRPRCPCWALGSRCTCRSLGAFRALCPRRTLGAFRTLRSRRTLWTFRALRSRRALWAFRALRSRRTLWTFRALRSRRALWAFRPLCSRRTLWAFRALGAGCSCGSRGTLGSY